MKFTICPICQSQMQGDPYRSMVSRIQRYYCGSAKKSQDAHFTFDGFDQTAIYFANDFTLFYRAPRRCRYREFRGCGQCPPMRAWCPW